jgi:acetylornithine deacetylase/succinyl-diaminopimelate desuccinylase-like protein
MDPVELLRELVSIDSVFPNERKIAEFVEQYLEQNGFATQRIEISEDRFNVVGERGTEGKPILFYGHLDTVPAYGQWDADPFELQEVGDKLIGLGAYDMKHGIATLLKMCEVQTDRRIKVAFGVDEENNSVGSYAIVQSGFVDDVEVSIVPEIASADTSSLGARAITLGRRGRCMIEIVVPGRACHGAMLEKGISAITEASRLAIELDRLNGSLGTHELLPPPTQFIRSMHSDSGSLSLPDSAVLELDRHMVVPETPESVLEQINVFIDGLYAEGKFQEIDGKKITARIKPREVPYLLPYVTPVENLFVQRIRSIVQEKVGEPVYSYGNSVADENVFAAHGIPMISVAAEGGNEHSANEWVSKKSFLELIEVYKKMIQEI